MRKVLCYNILIIILVFLLPNKGSGNERYIHPDISDLKNTEQQVCFSSTTTNLFSLFENNAELIPGCIHVTADSKTYIILSIVSRYSKDFPQPSMHLSPDLYFHPYPTLGKTKYYVFALGEIIV